MMDKKEEQELCLRAATLLQTDARIYHFAVDAVTLSFFIGHIQLALKHPQNNGSSGQAMKNLARQLIEQLDPTHGDLHRLMMHGFEDSSECVEPDIWDEEIIEFAEN